ncbi:hypothetical protein V4S33_07750 [Enterococcus cecorum]
MCRGKKKYFIVVGVCLLLPALWWLRFGREIDAYSTYSTSSEERLEEHVTFTVNRLYVTDKEACAREIIKKCGENDFQSVLFSYDMQKPTALYGTVYRFSWDIRWQKPLFTFRYIQEDDTLGIYNFIDNPEKFVLEIDEPTKEAPRYLTEGHNSAGNYGQKVWKSRLI